MNLNSSKFPLMIILSWKLIVFSVIVISISLMLSSLTLCEGSFKEKLKSHPNSSTVVSSLSTLKVIVLFSWSIVFEKVTFTGPSGKTLKENFL